MVGIAKIPAIPSSQICTQVVPFQDQDVLELYSPRSEYSSTSWNWYTLPEVGISIPPRYTRGSTDPLTTLTVESMVLVDDVMTVMISMITGRSDSGDCRIIW